MSGQKSPTALIMKSSLSPQLTGNVAVSSGCNTCLDLAALL